MQLNVYYIPLIIDKIKKLYNMTYLYSVDILKQYIQTQMNHQIGDKSFACRRRYGIVIGLDHNVMYVITVT